MAEPKAAGQVNHSRHSGRLAEAGRSPFLGLEFGIEANRLSKRFEGRGSSRLVARGLNPDARPVGPVGQIVVAKDKPVLPVPAESGGVAPQLRRAGLDGGAGKGGRCWQGKGQGFPTGRAAVVEEARTVFRPAAGAVEATVQSA